MVTEREVEIVIAPDGTVNVDQIGWTGKSCHGALDDLLSKIGQKIKVDKKAEFFKEEKVRIQTQH